MSDLASRRAPSIKRNQRSRAYSARPGEKYTKPPFPTDSRYSVRKFGVIQGQLKSPEDVAEELNSLRKRVSLLSSENELLQGRCRQLQEAMERKEKELAIFNQSSESAKLLQTLGDSRPQTIRAFKQLHQRIFRLENQLMEKQAEFNRLFTDLKFTRVEELRIQLDTAIEEVHRLQQLTAKQSEELAQRRYEEEPKSTTDKRKSKQQRELETRIAAMTKVIRSMDEERQMLLAKNHYLLNRIRQLLRNDDFPPGEIEKEVKNISKIPKRVESVSSEDTDRSREPDLIAKLVETKPNNKCAKRGQEALHAVRIGDARAGDQESEQSTLSQQTEKSTPRGSGSKVPSEISNQVKAAGDISVATPVSPVNQAPGTWASNQSAQSLSLSEDDHESIVEAESYESDKTNESLFEASKQVKDVDLGEERKPCVRDSTDLSDVDTFQTDDDTLACVKTTESRVIT